MNRIRNVIILRSTRALFVYGVEFSPYFPAYLSCKFSSRYLKQQSLSRTKHYKRLHSPLLRSSPSSHLHMMTSLSTTVRRTAARPQYLHLALRSSVAYTSCSPSYQVNKSYTLTSKRPISSTHQNQTKEYFPPPKTPNVKEVQTAWTHPVYVSSHS